MECIFCEFIKGRRYHEKLKSHDEEYPFIPLHECKNFFIFLGFPDNKKESDLLIIPKRHAERVEDLSSDEFKNLTALCQKVGKLIKKEFGDYKLFINNGPNAEQYIDHVHFHLMPYNSEKKPLWHDLSLDDFEKLSKKLKELFKHIR